MPIAAALRAAVVRSAEKTEVGGGGGFKNSHLGDG